MRNLSVVLFQTTIYRFANRFVAAKQCLQTLKLQPTHRALSHCCKSIRNCFRIDLFFVHNLLYICSTPTTPGVCNNLMATLNLLLIVLFSLFRPPRTCRLQKHGPRVKCSACKIITHVNCIGTLMERTKLTCKPTFRDVGIRQYREQTTTHHHWMHRRSEKGKCKHCGKVCTRTRFKITNILCI